MSLVEQTIVSAVAANQTAHVNLDAEGPTHDAVFIEYRSGASVLANDATMKSDLTKIKVIIDDETYWEVSGTQLLMLNDRYSLPRTTGYLPIYFARPEFLSNIEADNFALGTANVKKARLEISIASGVTTPSVVVRSLQRHKVMNMGQMLRVTARPIKDIGAAGTYDVNDMVDTKSGTLLKALHLDTDKITDARFRLRAGGEWADYTDGPMALHKLEYEVDAFKMGGNVDQTGWTHFQFSGERHKRLLPLTVEEMRASLTFNAAASGITVVREEVVGVPAINQI